MSLREKVVEKVAKLLALARSANPHEAESADKTARRLMLEHGVTQADVDGLRDREYHQVDLGTRGFAKTWRFALVTAAARHCGAEALAHRAGQLRRVRVCGRRSDVERAVACYADLLRAAERLKREERDESSVTNWWTAVGLEVRERGSRACAAAWYRGFVRGVAELMRKGAGGRGEGPPALRPSVSRGGTRGGRSTSEALARLPAVDSPDHPSAARRWAEAKWGPEVSRERLGGGECPAWFRRGREAALGRVRVDRDGKVVLVDEASVTLPRAVEDASWDW